VFGGQAHREHFVITKLSLVFDVFPNEEQAIASFAEPRSV
jgi:hypothetical protein